MSHVARKQIATKDQSAELVEDIPSQAINVTDGREIEEPAAPQDRVTLHPAVSQLIATLFVKYLFKR